MDEKLFFAVNLDTGQPVKSLGELKRNIRDLRKAIEKEPFGTKEFKRLQGQLTENKKALRQFNQSVNQTGSFSKKVAGSVVNSFKQMAAGIAAAFAAQQTLTFFTTDAIKAFDQQAKAEKSLEVALGRVSTALLNQASALQEVTTFGDEAIIQSQALLAEFGLSEEQILKLTPALLDFAAAQGTSVTDAAKLLSKTIGSSTNALSRYGIEVEGAVNSNERVESAIASLSEKFAGQAEATTSGAGAIQQFQNLVGDLQERIGGFIIKALNPVIKGVGSLVRGITDLFEPTNRQSVALSKQQQEFNLLVSAINNTNTSSETRSALIDELNKKFKDFLPNLITEKTTTEELAQAQREVNKAFEERIKLLALEEEIQDIQTKAVQTQRRIIELTKQREKLERDFNASIEDGVATNLRALENQDRLGSRLQSTTEELKKQEETLKLLNEEYAQLNVALITTNIQQGDLEEAVEKTNQVITNEVTRLATELEQIPVKKVLPLEPVTVDDFIPPGLTDAVVQTVDDTTKTLEESLNDSLRILGSFGDVFGALSNLAGENAANAKLFGIAEATVNTFVGATLALTDRSVQPAFLRIAQASAVVLNGLASVNRIRNVKAQDGMIINGPSHSNGGVPIFAPGGMIEAEGGEAIINKRATALFAPVLSAINASTGGVKFQNGGVTPIPNPVSVGQQQQAQLLSTFQGINFRPVVSIEEFNRVQTNVDINEQTATL